MSTSAPARERRCSPDPARCRRLGRLGPPRLRHRPRVRLAERHRRAPRPPSGHRGSDQATAAVEEALAQQQPDLFQITRASTIATRRSPPSRSGGLRRDQALSPRLEVLTSSAANLAVSQIHRRGRRARETGQRGRRGRGGRGGSTDSAAHRRGGDRCRSPRGSDPRGTGLTAAMFPLVLGGMIGGIAISLSWSAPCAASSPSSSTPLSAGSPSPRSSTAGSAHCRATSGPRWRSSPRARCHRRSHHRLPCFSPTGNRRRAGRHAAVREPDLRGHSAARVPPRRMGRDRPVVPARGGGDSPA